MSIYVDENTKVIKYENNQNVNDEDQKNSIKNKINENPNANTEGQKGNDNNIKKKRSLRPQRTTFPGKTKQVKKSSGGLFSCCLPSNNDDDDD